MLRTLALLASIVLATACEIFFGIFEEASGEGSGAEGSGENF
jgi:hypothetical protein